MTRILCRAGAQSAAARRGTATAAAAVDVGGVGVAAMLDGNEVRKKTGKIEKFF